MLFVGVCASATPPRVCLEELPDGRRLVRLADNIQVIGEDEGPVIMYDEAAFDLPADRREETVETITAGFDAWWAYGSTEQETPPTLEERVAALEDLLLME